MSQAAAVTTALFDQEVLNSDVPVLVDFWAPWCPPCRRVGPEVDAVAEQLAGSARVLKLDVDQEPDIAERYGVSSIPTMIVFKNGQPVDSLMGFLPRAAIAERLKAHV